MVKNKILLKNGKSVLPDRVFVGDLSIEDGVITHIRSDISESGFDKVYNLEGKYILPGFIDIHNHGSAGFDFSFGQYYTERDAFELEDDSYFPGLQNALQFYARRGTTKVLLTSMAAPLEKLEYSFSKLNEYQRNEMPFAELVGGINLEGTFLKDPHYAGAQNPKFFYDTDPSIIDRLQEASGNLLKIVNVPPEHGKQGLDLITSLRENNIVVAGGHTAAYGDEFKAAIDAGLALAVHFFNGPSRNSTKSFRQGGAEQAILRSDAVSTEIICDGYHVDPAHVRDTIARKESSRVIMITDSMFANGLSDLQNFSMFGLKGAVSKNREYLQRMGVADVLFGSVLATDKGFSNVLKWMTTEITGVWHRYHPAFPFDTALPIVSSMFSANPARLLTIDRFSDDQPGTGTIEINQHADLIIADIDDDCQLNIDKTFVRGKELISS